MWVSFFFITITPFVRFITLFYKIEQNASIFIMFLKVLRNVFVFKFLLTHTSIWVRFYYPWCLILLNLKKHLPSNECHILLWDRPPVWRDQLSRSLVATNLEPFDSRGSECLNRGLNKWYPKSEMILNVTVASIRVIWLIMMDGLIIFLSIFFSFRKLTNCSILIDLSYSYNLFKKSRENNLRFHQIGKLFCCSFFLNY